MPGKKGRTRRIALAVVLAAALASWLVVFFLPGGAASNWKRIFRFCGVGDFASDAEQSPLSIHVLNVGKADSILVESPNGSMLVDGGTASDGDSVVAYLKKRGISSLDLLVNTHPDSDHIGGLADVVRNIKVRRCLYTSLPKNLVPDTQESAAFFAALKDSGIQAEYPKAGAAYWIGPVAISVLGPAVPGQDTNNNSLVLKVTLDKTSFLLMGDAGEEEETSILAKGADLKADCIKVGHHGSSTSTTAALLSAVKPRYAVISVGNDANALPRLDVSRRLADAGATVFRTDINGTVVFLSDGKSIRVICENP